jgi:hypothetical protein
MAKEGEQLVRIVAAIIDKERNETGINPSWIATRAMLVNLDGATVQHEHPLVYLGCHLQLRQIARQLCRGLFEPDDDAQRERHPLFPMLQWRYPTQRSSGDEESRYVLLEQLCTADVWFNVKRLRADAESRLEHADALEAWIIGRTGKGAA